jgi:hypothetical protein
MSYRGGYSRVSDCCVGPEHVTEDADQRLWNRPDPAFAETKLTVAVAEDYDEAVVGGRDRMTCIPCQRRDTMPARHLRCGRRFG